jgi:hypothetical protein
MGKTPTANQLQPGNAEATPAWHAAPMAGLAGMLALVAAAGIGAGATRSAVTLVITALALAAGLAILSATGVARPEHVLLAVLGFNSGAAIALTARASSTAMPPR